MGEARGVEVETRAEESEAGKDEEATTWRPEPLLRHRAPAPWLETESRVSLSSLERPFAAFWSAIRREARRGGSGRGRKGEGLPLVPLPSSRPGADSHLSGHSQR